MEKNSERQPETLCKFCKKFIVTKNYMLHQGRCQRQQELRSSRVSNQSNQRENKKYQYSPFSQKFSNNNNHNRIFNTQPRKRNSYQDQFKKQKPIIKEEVQKIPCHFCGYLQTMEELDTHPNKCEHWQIQCEFCKQKFPKSLMDQHKVMCNQNPVVRRHNQQAQQRHRRRIQNNQLQSEHSSNQLPMIFRRRQRQMYQPSPLMDMFFGRNQFMRRHRHQNQQQESQPGINIIQFSSENGPRIIIRSNSSNPQNFIRLIQLLTNAQNRNQHPGLSQNELKELKRIKYLKNKPQADTCTICFCEFQEQQQLIELGCKHMFHQECILQWLKRVSTCPNCKQTVKQQQRNERRQIRSPQRGQPNRRNNGFFGMF